MAVEGPKGLRRDLGMSYLVHGDLTWNNLLSRKGRMDVARTQVDACPSDP